MTENDKKAIAFKDALIDFLEKYTKEHNFSEFEMGLALIAIGETTKKALFGMAGASMANKLISDLIKEKMN